MTKIYELGADAQQGYSIQVDSRQGNLYLVAYAGGTIPTDDLLAKNLTEENWKSSVIHMEGEHAQFFTGMVTLESTSIPSNTATVSLKRGLARFDLAVNAVEEASVKSVTLKNVAHSVYVFPQEGVTSPVEADRKDMTVTFTELVTDSKEGILYVYEQENQNIQISVTAVISGNETTLTKTFDGPLKRNTAYTITLRQDYIDIKLETSFDEWEEGGNTELTPDDKTE